MATFQITGPDGKSYRVTGDSPEDAARAVAAIAGATPGKPKAPKSLGQRLSENIFGDGDPNTQNFGEKVGTALNMAGEAMTFGLIGDEASGALADLIPGGMTGEERVQYERDQQEMLEDSNPLAAMGAQVAGGLMAPVAAAASAPAAIGIGAAGGATFGLMEGEGDLKDRAPGAVAGGVLGGAAGGAAIPIGKVMQWANKKGGRALRSIFANRRFFDGKTLSQEGRETLEALGYNVRDLSEDFVENFKKRVADLPPESAGRAAAMDEFGIPVYRHNATGSAEDFAAFERAKRGAVGQRAEDTAKAAARRQADAVTQAGEDISKGMADGVRGDQFDAAVSTQEGLRRVAASTKNAASKAYDDLAAAGGGVSGARVQNAGDKIKMALERAGRSVNPSATPNAAGALEELNTLFAGAERGSVPFMQLERGRQTLNRYLRTARRGANQGDISALQSALSGYDQFVDDAMTAAMIDGDKAAIDAAAKTARALWQRYSQQFTGDGAASKFVQRMIDEDASTDDMVRWLFSSGKLGSGKFNSTIAKGLKDILGEDSAEWGMVRQAAFRQLWQKPEGTVQYGPQAISSRVFDFLNNPATRGLAREVFSPQQQSQMRRYATALKRMVPPEGAVNHSGTAYENARLVREAFNGLLTAVGASGGGAPGAMGAMATARAVGAVRDRSAARALVTPSGTTGGPVGAASLGILGGEMGAHVGPSVAELFAGPLRLELSNPGNQ